MVLLPSISSQGTGKVSNDINNSGAMIAYIDKIKTKGDCGRFDGKPPNFSAGVAVDGGDPEPIFPGRAATATGELPQDGSELRGHRWHCG